MNAPRSIHGNRFAAAATDAAGIPRSQFSASGAAVPVVMNFPMQSGFLYSTATGGQGNVLPQQPNPLGINPSTLIVQQVEGCGFALLPSSQTPVSVLPDSTQGAANSAAVILKPGQVYYPGGRFRAFKWGLPYGWLGGGLANLLVFREENGYAFWASEPEILFHKVTVPIFVGASLTQAALPSPNWPLRFPWPFLTSTFASGSVASVQPPQLNVTPTRYVCRLVSASNGGIPAMANGCLIRLTIVKSDDMDQPIIAASTSPQDLQSPGSTPTYGTLQGADSSATTTRGSSYDLAFGSWAASGLTIAASQLAEDPVVTLSGDQLRMGGDQAVLLAADVSGFLTSGNFALEISRYGRIGG